MSARKTDQPLPDPLIAALLDALQPMELGTEHRNRLRQRVLQQAHDATPEGTITLRSDQAEWREVAPLVFVRELSRDEATGTHISLVRMQPGGVIEPHRHSKEEEFTVLEGECHIGTHLLSVGDTHRAAPGSHHCRVTTRTGVLVLIRGEYPYPAAQV